MAVQPVEARVYAKVVVIIATDMDIIEARREARRVAVDLGFRGSEPTLIATAVSELARNILVYAKSGSLTIDRIVRGPRTGLAIAAHDQGPGIVDVDLAMQDGYSTTKSLGIGLPGARRLLDEFEVRSQVGVGTTVNGVKWLP